MTGKQFKVKRNQLYKKLSRNKKAFLMPNNNELKDVLEMKGTTVLDVYDAILELEKEEKEKPSG